MSTLSVDGCAAAPVMSMPTIAETSMASTVTATTHFPLVNISLFLSKWFQQG